MTGSAKILAASLLVLALSACTREAPPVRIGFAANLTGRSADVGIDARNGAQLAVEEINAVGGIGGRKLEMIVRDDENKPDTARKVMQEFAEMLVPVVVGHIVSGMTLAALPIANEKRLLLVSPTSVSNVFTGKDDYLIRVSPAAGNATAAFADFARRQVGVGSVAALYDLSNKGYTEDWFKGFARTFAAGGGRVTEAVTYTAGAHSEFPSLAKKLLASRPEGVVLIAGAADTAMLCQQIRRLDEKIPIFIAGWAVTAELLEKGGRAVENVWLSYNFDRDSTLPNYVAFKEAFARRFGKAPDFSAKFSYETVMVIRDALIRYPDADSDALKTAILAQGRFPGLQGEFRIDANGDADAQAVILTVSNGAYRRVE